MRPLHVAASEQDDLEQVLGDPELARLLVAAPGGWRGLSDHELEVAGLDRGQRRAVTALLRLVRHGFPKMPRHRFLTPEDVAEVYCERLGTERSELMVAIALDGRSRCLAELEVGRGGKHSLSLTTADILRPLIRVGASTFILVHNHPSGCAEPSADDVTMTGALADISVICGVPLVDHVIVAAHGGGFTSLRDLGLVPQLEEHEDGQRAADTAIRP